VPVAAAFVTEPTNAFAPLKEGQLEILAPAKWAPEVVDRYLALNAEVTSLYEELSNLVGRVELNDYK
jgi:hypothetical protein